MASRVRGGDLRFERGDDVLTLELEGGGDHVVVGSPRLGGERVLGGRLETDEFAGSARGFTRVGDFFDDGGVRAELVEVAGDVFTRGELFERRLVDDDDGDGVRVFGIGVRHRHADVRALLEDVFNLAQGDVFTLLKLDQILLTIDNHELTVGGELPDVSGVKVSNAVDDAKLGRVLRRELGIGHVRRGVIPLTHHGSTDENLTSRETDGWILFVFDAVTALLPIAKRHAHRRQDLTDGGRVIVERGDRPARPGLGQSVPLTHGASEARLHEDLRLSRQRRRTGDHDAHATADELLHLFKDERIVQERRADATVLEVSATGFFSSSVSTVSVNC